MRCLKFFLIVLNVQLYISGVAHGEIYKWVDKNGIMHFGDSPPQDVETARKLESLPATPPKDPEPQASPIPEEPLQELKRPIRPVPRQEELTQPMMDAQVEIFMTRWCGYCKKAREFFAERGIAVTEYDIAADSAAAQRKQKIYPSPGVPLVVINGHPIQGFAPHAYKQALAPPYQWAPPSFAPHAYKQALMGR